jgi:hypothetical protein
MYVLGEWERERQRERERERENENITWTGEKWRLSRELNAGPLSLIRDALIKIKALES